MENTTAKLKHITGSYWVPDGVPIITVSLGDLAPKMPIQLNGRLAH